MEHVQESCSTHQEHKFWSKQPIFAQTNSISEKGRLTQLLLLQDEEDGVDQFKVLEVVVDDVERHEPLFLVLTRTVVGKRMRVTRSAFSIAHSLGGNDEVILTGVKALVLQMDQKAPCRMYKGTLKPNQKRNSAIQSSRPEL